MINKRTLKTMAIVTMLTLAFGTQAMAASSEMPTSGSVDLTNAPMTDSMRTLRSSENVGGGSWDYGTGIAGWEKKKVWSNYMHPDKKHHASCSIGANLNKSGTVNAGKTAFSSATGKSDAKTHAYWGIDE